MTKDMPDMAVTLLKQQQRRQQWADSLKNYQQNRGSLRYEDEYCVLGVAVEEYRKATGNGQWAKDHRNNGYYVFIDPTDRYWRASFPGDVCTYYGLDWRQAHDLAVANDGGHTFDELTKKIKAI